MKKQFLIGVFFLHLSGLICFAQEENTEQKDVYVGQENECIYLAYNQNKNEEIEFIQTEPVMVEEWTTPLRGRVIDFSLIYNKGNVILYLEITEDAEENLNPICIGNDSRITFRLKNGNYVSLPQFGEKVCGFVNQKEADYSNITNRGFFLIDQNNLQQLQSSEVYIASLQSKKYQLDFIFRSELYDEINDYYVYPELYFMSELDCVLDFQK
ncbi:hypothetical protein [Psychroflexus maritimus]|uniref:Uncharacterized protein n=1 Tax=Psychroflexus maritimus TaxID=2714865 RepID=A0A967AHK8_9FLAO|nr:hypothetical protein [Psychroflexus maritimus]NGZ89520.1 hypothetical protein [Psychroflexus maritimus]